MRNFFSFQLKILPYHFAVFSINLTAPDYEGIFSSDMLITTQFEVGVLDLCFK